MLEQFKLRLRDGTVLSVDHDGLRTWLLDDKVMVQPPGSSRWRPLRQLLAQESLDAQRAPAPAAPVPSAPEPAPEEEVIFFPPTGREESPLPVARTPLDEIAEPARPIVLSPAAEVAAPARPTVITPLAEAAVAPPREAGHAIPIIPLKRLDDEPPRARVDVEGPSLLDVARAAVERHGASDRPWQWAPPEPRPVVPAATAAPPSAPGREAAAETAEDLEEIDLVAEDELPHVPRPIGVPPAVNPLQVPPAVQAVVSRISGWIERLMRRARQLASPAPGKPRATSPEEIHPWAVALPPPPLSALPSLRLAPIDDDEAPRPRRARLLGLARAWSKRAMLGAGALALLVVVASTSSTWMPRLWRVSRPVAPAASPPAQAAPARPEPPPLPKEVQAAIAELPHLSPETVQLVMASRDLRLPDPPEVFRRAYAAANRGASALTDPEAQELKALRAAVLAPLRPLERERVRAYDRTSVGNGLLVAEDGKVMALFTRGVRALSPARRDRLRELLAKAVAAGAGPRPPAGEAGR